MIEKMLVTQALDERDLLVKKINDNRNVSAEEILLWEQIIRIA